MKKVAILQSNYIPWKGYFDIIAAVDEFVIYDEVQFTRRDWRNRNLIKTPQGLHWLTVPVGQSIHRRIRDVALSDAGWQKKHWKTLSQHYAKAPFFKDMALWLEPLYLATEYATLSEMNLCFIRAICGYLSIFTVIKDSSNYTLCGDRSERLLNLCLQAGAQEYVSGPAAKSYLDEALFTRHGLAVTWFSYEHYPEYPQTHGPFRHGVSILDLLFQCGPRSVEFMQCRPAPGKRAF
jgi:hypothetical protein